MKAQCQNKRHWAYAKKPSFQLKLQYRLILLLLLVCGSRPAAAQFDESIRQYRLWRVDVSAGRAMGLHPGNRLGGLATAEARYNFDDVLSFGLRLGMLQMGRGFFDESLQLRHGDMEISTSILGTADYYVNEGRMRAFVGVGTGIFKLTSATHTMQGGNTLQVPAEARFGWMLRTGGETGHVRLTGEFNGIGKSAGIFNHYAGISLGIIIGGGKLKPEAR